MRRSEDVRKVAEEAVRSTLFQLGVDADNAAEMRKDMAELRKMRQIREKGGAALVWAVVTTLFGGIAVLVWEAIKGAPR
jgi:hypothetical protein